MIREVQLGRMCDTLRQQLEKEVALGVNAQVSADSVIQAQQSQIAIRDEGMRVQTDRITNQQKANGELKKQLRHQRALTVAVGIVSVLAIIIIL